MSKQTKFWNRIARKYAAQPVPDEKIYQQKLQLSQQYLSEDSEVLEIGCGTGTTALHHASKVKHVTGVDYSSEMIEIAKEKAAKQGAKNAAFRCADANTVLNGKQVDVVMAHSLLHLLADKNQTIKDAAHALKPGGYFISSTVCLTGMWRLLQPVWPPFVWLNIFPKVYFFSSAELRASHRQAGLEIEYIWQTNKLNVFIVARKPA